MRRLQGSEVLQPNLSGRELARAVSWAPQCLQAAAGGGGQRLIRGRLCMLRRRRRRSAVRLHLQLGNLSDCVRSLALCFITRVFSRLLLLFLACASHVLHCLGVTNVR